MTRKPWMTRRNVLRGMGVTLALPWLETFSSPVRAQAAGATTRYIFLYWPNGVARDFWPPMGTGEGDAWQMSAIQEPLFPYKQYVSVLSNLDQVEVFGMQPNPSHSQLAGPTWTCVKNHPSNADCGGPSIDQVIAQNIGAQTAFESLQTGLSTVNSYPDGQHPAISRSMSWSNATTPLYKEVDPKPLWDRLVTQLGPGGSEDPAAVAAAEMRRARDLSALDFVLEDAASLQQRLSASDRIRLEQFLDSAQDLQTRVQMQMPGTGGGATVPPEPMITVKKPEGENYQNAVTDPADYNRDVHAELMNDLITFAFATDLTRVVSHMLDDARSDYHYNFLKQRSFSGLTSTETQTQLTTLLNGDLLGFHGLQHDGDSNDGFATVNHWLIQKFASLIQRFTTTPDPVVPGKMLIDTTFMQCQSGMQGSNHQADQLPVLIAGSGGGVFKMNQHVQFPGAMRLANLHLTVLQNGFGLTNQASFGNSNGIIPEILA